MSPLNIDATRPRTVISMGPVGHERMNLRSLLLVFSCPFFFKRKQNNDILKISIYLSKTYEFEKAIAGTVQYTPEGSSLELEWRSA